MIRTRSPRARRANTWPRVWIPLALLFTAAAGREPRPELVPIPMGDVTLQARLFRPAGHGPFPAILINHGSGPTAEELKRLGPYERWRGSANVIGSRSIRRLATPRMMDAHFR